MEIKQEIELISKLKNNVHSYIKCKMPEAPTEDEIEDINKFLIKLRLIN